MCVVALPVVKWAGGKRRLLGQLTPRLPPGFRGYHEPFLGGGALFFETRPAHSLLTDANGELIALYKVIKHRPRELMAALTGFSFTRDEYFRLRNLDRVPGLAALDDVERAARFLYLNKTGFNGLWSVNAKGQSCIGWGHRSHVVLYSPDNIMAVHEALRTARLAQAHFSHVLKLARAGEFVYFDPPYDTQAGTDSVGYTAQRFGRRDQHALWQVCVKLHRMGVKWMLSNADTPFIRQLFRAFHVEAVMAPRSVLRDGGGRIPAPEVIVRNY